MVMETLQVRLSGGLLKTIDELVKEGIYASRSDAIREAVRAKFFWQSQIGLIRNDGKDSVNEISRLRKKLSKEINDYEDIRKINSL
ncbi:MAG: ribbon-helix-helix protein, CopG family [archaeon]